MKISFDKFKSKKDEDEKLFCLLSGIRGSGKSTAIGTLGVKTLVIASGLESHAFTAAKLFGKENILKTLYDIDEDTNKQLKPDVAIQNLHDILDFLITSEDTQQNIEAIALDSFGAIDKTLLETTRVSQEKNNFEAMNILENEHFRIIRKLKELHRKGLHIIATMPISGKFDDEGFYLNGTPQIRGIRTTQNIMGVFPELLVCAFIRGEYVFQMNVLLKKVGKAVSGEDKEFPSYPRINGLSNDDVKEISGEDWLLPSNLSYIYELKKIKLQNK